LMQQLPKNNTFKSLKRAAIGCPFFVSFDLNEAFPNRCF